MQPLYENHVDLTKPLLLEWSRKEFIRSNPYFAVMHLAMVAVYLLLAGTMVANRAYLPPTLFYSGLGLLLLLAVVFLLYLVLSYLWQVNAMLREDELENAFPNFLSMVYYEQFAMPTTKQRGQNPAAVMLECAESAAKVQAEFSALMEEMESLGENDMERLQAARPQLEGLQKQLDEIAQRAAGVGSQGEFRYESITDYTQTKHLHMLYFGDDAVLMAKNGFTLGDNESFCAFIAEKLRLAAAATSDEKQRKQLEKALRKELKQPLVKEREMP